MDTIGPPAAGETADSVRRATVKEWAGLALLALPMMALATDLTVLFFALPTLSADLGTTATQTLWITHVYGFLIAGFLVTAGRVGDRIGPRRLMLIGAAAFAVLSVVAAFSTSAEMLIAARAALGVAGATLMPSLFSLLRTMFPDEGQRRLAIAIMFSTFTVGGAVGPVLGGAMLEFFWWGSVFLINVPPLALLLVVGRVLIPERADRDRARIDLISVALSVTGMLAIVYGFQELAASQETGEGGGAWLEILSFVAGLAVMGLFVRRQRRLADPLFDLALLREPRLSVSLITLVLMGTSMVGMFYLFTQHLQWVLGLSPLQAGLWTLPYIGVNIAGAMVAPGLAGRFSSPIVVVGGMLTAAAGAVGLLLFSSPDAALPLVVGAIATAGFGHGAAGALLSDLIISSAPQQKTGSAASAQEVGGELGSALGIAVGGTVSVLAYRHHMAGVALPGMPAPALETAAESVNQGVEVAGGLGADGPVLLAAIEEAASLGQRLYAGIGAAVLTVAAAVVLLVLVRGARR